MSKLTDQLRAYAIFNSHGFAHARGVQNDLYNHDRPAAKCRAYRGRHIVPMIDYIPAQPGRGYKSACWQVSQGHITTDPNAHWRDYGRKTFDVQGREQKAVQFEAAKAWASEHFGVTEWKREPFGAYMPAEFVDARLAQLKAWIKSLDNPSGTK